VPGANSPSGTAGARVFEIDHPSGVAGVLVATNVPGEFSPLEAWFAPFGDSSLEGGLDCLVGSLPTKVASDEGTAFPHFPHAAALGGFSALQ
jgi:hypothetical protein